MLYSKIAPVLLAQIPFWVGDSGVATKGKGKQRVGVGGQWAGSSSGAQGCGRGVVGAQCHAACCQAWWGLTPWSLVKQGLQGHRAGVCLRGTSGGELGCSVSPLVEV